MTSLAACNRSPPARLHRLLKPVYTPDALSEIVALLEQEKTLRIGPLASGLFSAAVVTDYSAATNYHAAWVRDNVHVAYAHHVHGRTETAVRAATALARFFASQAPRFDAVIDEPGLKERDVMLRPHIRFNGDDGSELSQTWAHAQNDALGGFLWLYATLARDREIVCSAWDCATIGRLVNYLRAIRYWEDEDSGHWEEARKVSASSIGVVVAGLRRLREWVVTAVEIAGEDTSCSRLSASPASQLRAAVGSPRDLDALIDAGETALFRILPSECIQSDPAKRRDHDAALLFLIYPFEVVNSEMAEKIACRTRENLMGSVGIRRYPGDSFYCTDYEGKMQRRSDDPTRDFSEDMATRDALLRSGDEEAQWCLFDSILSIHYGKRYLRHRDPEDLAKQTEHLNRALRQITDDDPPRCRAFQCAELYYREGDRIQCSKSVPLLWSQANLWSALEVMRASLKPT